MFCMTDGDPWSVKQHHWKSEAKEDNQLSSSGPSNTRELRSQPTKINWFRSGPSWSLTPNPQLNLNNIGHGECNDEHKCMLCKITYFIEPHPYLCILWYFLYPYCKKQYFDAALRRTAGYLFARSLPRDYKYTREPLPSC